MLKYYLTLFSVLLGASQAFGVTISGNIFFEKIVHTRIGTTSSVSSVIKETPLAGARIYNQSGVLQTTTGTDGTYSVEVTGSTVLEVRAQNDLVTVGRALSGSGMSGIHSVTIYSGSPGSDVTDNDVVIAVATNVNSSSDEYNTSGAFNIFSEFNKGLDWFQNLGYTLQNQDIRVIWPGSGSFFEPTNFSVNLFSEATGNGDNDGFDDSVIQHEFGHVAMEAFSIDSSNGGSHSFTSKEDLRLSWSEGVANYLSCAIRDSSEYLDTTNYNSSTERSIAGLIAYFDDIPSTKGAENESSVAYVLWEAQQAHGLQAVIDTLGSFTQLSEQISMDSFHDRWEIEEPTSDLTSTYALAGMTYFEDVGSGSFSTPVFLTTSQSITDLTFYGKNDEDIFNFVPSDSGFYSFNTADTTNGALTSLFLYDTDQITVLQSNDQANGSLADTTSRTTSQWLAAGSTYYLKTERFTSSTKNYGRGFSDYSSTVGSYGGYSLSATLDAIAEPEVTGVTILNSTARMGDTLSITFSTGTVPIPDSFSYLWFNNGNTIIGQTSPTLTLTSEIGVSKGDEITCEVTPGYQGTVFSSGSNLSSGLIISNSVPEVYIGEDVSVSDNIFVREAIISDEDSGDSFSYNWVQASGNNLSIDASASNLSLVLAYSGVYSFSLTVNDGTDDSPEDQFTLIFDALYVEATNRTASTNLELTTIASTNVTDSASADNLLDQAYSVAQSILNSDVVTAVVDAVEKVTTSNEPLTAEQVSKTLMALDNAIDEDSQETDALIDAQLVTVSQSIASVLNDNPSIVGTKDYLKAFEVFDEFLNPFSEGGLSSNLVNATEESLGTQLISISQGVAEAVSVGEKIEVERENLELLGEAFVPGVADKVVSNSAGNLSITIPSTYSSSNISVSLTRMDFNPHADSSSATPNSSVITFIIKELASNEKPSLAKAKSFAAKEAVTMTIPVTEALAAGESYVPKYFNGSSWTSNPISDIDTDTPGVVSFKTTEFGEHAVFIEGDSPAIGGGGGGGGCMLSRP